MSDIYRSDIVPVDLNHALSRKHVGSVLATGDNGANRFGASVLRDGKAVDLTGCGVTAYFMRPGQNALVLQGQTDGHVAYVDLAQACYTLQSSFTLTIKVTGNGITSALRIIDGYILLTQTEELDAPAETVPTLDELLAQIAAMEAATDAAEAVVSDYNGKVLEQDASIDALTQDIGKCIKASSVVVNGPTKYVAPYNDMDTLPVGQVVTYIGNAYYPANLPANFTAKTGVFTVLTFNYNNTKVGGAVQVIYTTETCYWRTASTETAYSAWVTVETPARLDSHLTAYKRETIKGYTAINSADKFVEPYTDMDTLPVGSVLSYIGSAYRPANVPPHFNCKSGLFTVMTFNYSNNWTGGSVQILYTPQTVYYRFRITETAYEEWVTLHDADAELNEENLMPLFETVGVIGDSYSSGAVSVNGVVADHYDISWGQIMARRNGITCTNFSAGGLTTRTWLTHERGASLLQSESAKKLYIIALGINDNALLKAEYLGTAADIKMSDYTKNPDTFYGNYGRIIAMVKEKAPNAKIVISTMAPSAPGNYVAAYNAAIEEIAGLMGIPLLVQGDDHYFTSRLYKNNIVNNHPLASGYAHMAAAFERMICKAMNDNQSYFADYVG